MRLKILTHKHPTVRAQAAPVDAAWFQTPAARQLIADMLETMHAANGIGLAAPQIGQAIRLAVIAHRDGDLVFGNPVIQDPSSRLMTEEEGCLSVPGVFGLVARHHALTVEYLDAHGRSHTRRASGLFARVIQHETDHLDGRLYIDRTTTFTHGRP